MNTERMLKLATSMERNRVGVRFKMTSICSDISAAVGDNMQCGTTCCIAGIVCLMFGERGSDFSAGDAAELLQLTNTQSCRLFYNHGYYISPKTEWGLITKKEAVAAIRRMVKEEGDA